MNRHTILRGALAAGVLGLALAGCGSMRPSQRIAIYEATLSGSQEVPPTPSGGSGQAEVQLDTANNMITWKVTYGGLSAPPTAGHIHGPAGPGQNAGVLVPFSLVVAQPIQGSAQLTPAQVAELAAGRMYVNLHTTAFPGGEIRGQLQRRGG